MTRNPELKAAPADAAGAASHRIAAQALIRRARTLVLSTSAAGAPWAAPVYYVYVNPGFFFFSSPRARHIEQGISAGTAAAAIFADSERWEEIQGLQMSGTVSAVRKRSEQLKVVARFLLKFPFARPFLESEPSRKQNRPHVGDRVQLYVFVPRETYYLNNRLGFGQRVLVDLNG
ncbi:MAG: hypothetical protein C4519_19705 [Desulfobacteraceae bacterium]|nr:MAG: hypothetical protein C4519_19705 [Desulfobacteraceae bacterium]